MFVVSISGKEEEGAYSAFDEYGEQVLYIFQEEDDAIRFAMMLEDNDDFPEMTVVELEKEDIIKACKIHQIKYQIFTAEDIVVPPEHFSYDTV